MLYRIERNTLAVGAFSEDSDAKGVGGDQQRNAAFGAGAVYVLTRAGAQWSHVAYVKAANAEPPTADAVYIF